MRAEAERFQRRKPSPRPGLLWGLQLPGLSYKVRHDVEVVVAAEHGKPVLRCRVVDSDTGQDLQFDALRLRSRVPPLAQALAVLPQWW
jgi:hypothetical protein